MSEIQSVIEETVISDENKTISDEKDIKKEIPLVLRKQGSVTNCSDSFNFNDSNCPCNGLDVAPKKNQSQKINLNTNRSLIPLDRLNDLRKKVQEAIKTHKVFTIRGCFYTIRKTLVSRGWVEKLDLHRRAGNTMPSNCLIEDLIRQLPSRRPGESRRQHLAKCERNVMSRLLEYVAVDFLWTARKEKNDFIDMARNPGMIVNKFNKVPFTSKESLCSTLKDFHWFYEEGTSECYLPRCYNVWNPEELTDFMENFRLTACISMLTWFVEKSKNNKFEEISSTMGTIPISSLNFAISRCNEFIQHCQHYDIDNNDLDAIRIWEHDWDVFFTNHNLVTHENGKLQLIEDEPLDPVLIKATRILEEVKQYWPQYDLDGYLNIWIVKPGNRCRGRGILLMNNIKEILTLINPQIVTKTRYVVQKYIERPLIIHKTKFDIRQWFLITSVQPMIIWMYKESYLRFSSQQYNLLNYHESVHLTNHAIQKKYTNGVRDERLPNENMWDCHTFQAYLRQIGQMEMWTERIYPGMQKAIIGTLLASQENMDRRINTFELFGADFMISEDFYPWLIEINSSPDLGATTSVTARMCPQCLEDIIKVVVDRRINPTADTGEFEMIYKQVIPPVPAYMGLNLFLKGQQILPKGGLKKDRFREDMKIMKTQTLFHLTKTPMKMVQPTQGPVIVDFLDFLNSTKNKTLESKITSTRVFRKYNFSSNSNSLGKINQSNNRFQSTGGSRLPRSLADNLDKKSDFTKRHASCGPKVMIQTEDVLATTIKSENSLNKELECIGNNCLESLTSEWETNLNISPSSSASIRKPSSSLENLINLKTKSAALVKSNRRNPSQTQQQPNLNHRKYSSSSVIDNSNSMKKIKNNYCSNFFAVGLSLRAWRAKYNKIIKTQKENLQTPVARSCPPSIIVPRSNKINNSVKTGSSPKKNIINSSR